MRDYWIDHNGKQWIVPQIKGRLKFRIPSHAALKEFVLHRAGYKCEQCGFDNLLKLIADHIISRRNGGQHHPDNMQCLCESCNARKVGLVDARLGK
jgi:5-methylcytosine-specific restriction endonuclease McrA